MADITPPGRNDPFVDGSGVPTQRATDWAQKVSRLSIIEGDGSPEGVITAAKLREYWDNVGLKKYIKSTAGGNTGWIALN